MRKREKQPMMTHMRIAMMAVCVICSVTAVRGAKLADAPAAREVLSLDGVWNFATDSAGCGEAEKWFLPGVKLPAMPLPGYATTADGTIRVPGIWDNQGYGTETDKVRHNFVGKGWYQRTVEIPEGWSGKSVFLKVTGVSRYSKTWVNGQYLGEHIGYLSVQEHEVTQQAVPGQAVTVAIQVDSKQRWEVDTLFGASSLADYMDVAWGGIWGHVLLEARADAWLTDLFVQPDVPGSSCTASATLSGKAGLLDGARLEVFETSGKRVADAAVKLDPATAAGQPVSVTVALPGAHLWTPDTPTLYTARLSLLKGSQVRDTVDSRFGMRQFTVEGYSILLNGKRIMLRGYGDDHIYPVQMAMPSDKALHLKQLRLIKSYGFNHVRHHSTIMPPEYYEACDEVGIITTVEFPIVYAPYLPGTGKLWQKNVPPGTDPKPAFDTYHREWAAAITRHRNHPSILCWVMGNELYADIPLRSSFMDIAHKLDPKGLYLDSDGVDKKLLSDPKRDRPTVAIYDIQYLEWDDPVVSKDKFKTPKPIKPVISHETGNYITFSRPDLVDLFQHNIKPFWMSEGQAKLEKLGLLREATQWAKKSERLYAYLHKCNLEALRKNAYLSGYHWWLFQDYWTSANGLVDHYFRPKSITAEEVRTYNSEVVLLQDGLDQTCRGKTRLEMKLRVSNFSAEPLQGELAWEVKAGEKTVAEKKIAIAPVPQGDVAEATQISLELPETSAPVPLQVTATLTAGGKRYSNGWSARLYPSVILPQKFPVPVFASVPQSKAFASWGVAPIPFEGALDSRAVYVTDNLSDPRLADAMARGACVVCLGSLEPYLNAYPLTFRTTWWKAGETPEKNNSGTFVYDHSITRAVAPDGWCDGGWFYLVEGAQKYNLEKAPSRPDVIVRALPSMAMVQDEAILFAVGAGKGSLIVSGLNHGKAEGRPENDWILARLLDHAATLPHPKAVWPITFLSSTYAAPEGCLPGFRRVVTKEGSAAPEKGSWFSYREKAAPFFICRQNKKGNAVVWETVPYLPKAQPDERVTFAFAGSLGFSSEPKTEGFALDVNGIDALRFDMLAADRWTSADKRVALRFEPRKTVAVDRSGLFYVTLARDLLKPGQPCQLGVRSLGAGSQRWFGLNPYTDVLGGDGKQISEAGLLKLGLDSGYEIVIPDSTDIVERTAADELKHFLGKAGLYIKIVPESESVGKKRFLLGRESNLKALGEFSKSGALRIRDISPLDDGFHLKRIGADFVVAGVTPRSVLYGVYAFEDYVHAGAGTDLDCREVPNFQKRFSGPGHYLNQVTEDHLEERIAYLSRCKMNRVMLGAGCTLGTLSDWVQSDVFPSVIPRADVVRKIKTMSALYNKYGIDTYVMLWEPSLPPKEVGKYPPEVLGSCQTPHVGVRQTLCINNETIQNYYRNLMGKFVREYPDVKGVLFYNLDGNAWLCTPTLCPRCKEACKDSPPDMYNPWESQARLVTLLTEAAHRERPDFDFCFWGMVHYSGELFKKMISAANVDSLASTWSGGDCTVAISGRPELLAPGFELQRKMCLERNIPLVVLHAFSNYEMVPKSMPYPFHVADSLRKIKGWGSQGVFDGTGPDPTHNPINTLVAKAFLTNPDLSPEKFLADLSVRQFGAASGKCMFQAWDEIRQAFDVWIDRPYSPLMGSMFFINPAINAVVFPQPLLPKQSISAYYNEQVDIRIQGEPFQATEFLKFKERAFLDKMAVMSAHYAQAADCAKQAVALASDKDPIGLCYYEGDAGPLTCKNYAELNYAAIALADFACRMQCNVLRAYHLEKEGNAAQAARDEQTVQAKNKQFIELVREDLVLQEQFGALLTGFATMKPCYTRTSLRDQEIAQFLKRTRDKIEKEKAFLAAE